MKRISQRDLLPSAIKNRGLGQKVINTTETQSASATLSNGDQTMVSVTVVADLGATILSDIEITLWHGSVSILNLLPGGSSVDESAWQIIGPRNEWSFSGGTTEVGNDFVVSRTYIRNISAGASQTLNVRVRAKYITNLDVVSI